MIKIYIDFEVIEDFDHPNGKFPDTYGNALIFDCQHLLPALVESFKGNILKVSNNKEFVENINRLTEKILEININDFAMQADAVVTHRTSRYFSAEKVNFLLIKSSLLMNNFFHNQTTSDQRLQ